MSADGSEVMVVDGGGVLSVRTCVCVYVCVLCVTARVEKARSEARASRLLVARQPRCQGRAGHVARRGRLCTSCTVTSLKE